MANNVVCKIDGVIVPTPKNEMSFQSIDLQSEGYTDALGFTHKETVRFGKNRYNLEWGYLTEIEYNLIESLTAKEWFAFEISSNTDRYFYMPKAYRGNIDGTVMTMRKGVPEYKNVKIAMVQE